MNRPMGILLLVIGVVLLVYGFQANDSLASSTSRLFTGAPTNKALVLMAAGAVLTISGFFSVFGGSKS